MKILVRGEIRVALRMVASHLKQLFRQTHCRLCMYIRTLILILFSLIEKKREREEKKENHDNRSPSLSYREYVIFNFQVVLQKKYIYLFSVLIILHGCS
jgi:hypothetical protein